MRFVVSTATAHAAASRPPRPLLPRGGQACNHYRLYNGKSAEAELKTLGNMGINVNVRAACARTEASTHARARDRVSHLTRRWAGARPRACSLAFRRVPRPHGHGALYRPASQDHPLLRHNLVVFRGGQGALQVLPSLVSVVPEARLNLVGGSRLQGCRGFGDMAPRAAQALATPTAKRRHGDETRIRRCAGDLPPA